MHRYLLSALLFFGLSHAQQPEKPTSAELYHKIEKLNFLGSALYLAAHPDDENTRLISYLANTTHARTGYLSLTRGDGGQNLIGNELRELLGVIRTQELIEARRIDGGEQFFSRANDFGFSKMPDETLQIWNKEQVLQDMVWVIRNFQPDVIITRFDHRSPGTTHGHHTSSAMLAQEAFELAKDPNYEPGQLQYTQVWNPSRLFFNVSYWFFGSKENFEKADKSKYVNLSTGTYYTLLGKSNQEIAALSRSRHKSQGFGSTGERGEDMEYLELIKGPEFNDRKNLNLFEGIDTSWSRVKGGKPIGDAVAAILKNYDFKNPSASVPALLEVYKQLQALEDGYWKNQKLQEIKDVIAECCGLYLEAVADAQSVTPGSTLKVKWEAINRSDIPVSLGVINGNQAGGVLENNMGLDGEIDIKLPEETAYTSPYWLMEPGTAGMYAVNDLKKIGRADIIRETGVRFGLVINAVPIVIERPVVYKYNDPVDGEVYQPLDVVPAVTTRIANKVQLFTDDDSQTVSIKIKAGQDNCKGSLRFELPAGWEVTPASIPFELKTKGSEVTVAFEVTAPDEPSEVTGRSIATMDGKDYGLEQTIINYPHINIQQVLLPSTAKFTRANVRIKGRDIAYLMGAGDNVPASLEQMGYNVTLLPVGQISAERLKDFDAVVVGIRAYNVLDGLAYKQQTLMDYVQQGGTMVVQYNTTGALVTKNVGPYPLRISRDRVTEEDASVTFIDPKHRILNYPNKLTEADFKGWIQEQGLYYPDEWAPEYTPVISSHDKGEPDKKSAILVAKYGKGYYVYTGLSFFRELPEGVSGAYRLMANLIAIGQ